MQKKSELVHPEAAVAPGYLANHLARVFNRLVDAALRPHGVSLALIGPVLLLSWKGPMLQRDIVVASAVKQPAMVALLDKLESMGLVERSSMPHDRRMAMVRLTERGETIAAVGKEALVALNVRAVAGFSEAEAALAVTLLHRLITNLERTPEMD